VTAGLAGGFSAAATAGAALLAAAGAGFCARLAGPPANAQARTRRKFVSPFMAFSGLRVVEDGESNP
jgi:hypothetical protein